MLQENTVRLINSAFCNLSRTPQSGRGDAGGVAAGLARNWLLWLGVLLVLVPTIVRQAVTSSTGSLGPLQAIVTAIAAWLIAREWPTMRAAGQRGRAWIGALVLGPMLILYALARITLHGTVEQVAAYGAMLGVLYCFVGMKAMSRAWFVLAYPLLAIPVDPVVDPLTIGLRLHIAEAAVALLRWAGYLVGQVGQVLFIDSYTIVLVEACSGLTSIVSLSAIGLFYVYLNRGADMVYCALGLVVMVALAIQANLVRVMAIVLLTHYLGDAAAQGFLHEFAGLVMFAVALGGAIALDAVAWPLYRRARRL